MIEIKIPDSLKELKKRHRDLIKNSFTKALKNIRKAKDMCEKPKPIETEDGIYMPDKRVNFDCVFRLMKDHDWSFICGDTIYIYDDKQIKYFSSYLNEFIPIISINFLRDLDWWSTTLEEKGWRQRYFKSLNKNSQEIKKDSFKIGDIVCLDDKGFVVKYEGKGNPIGVLKNIYSSLPKNNSVHFYKTKSGDYVEIYIGYCEPLQERKEMEEYELDNSDNKDYSLKDLEVGKVYYMLDTDFYRLSEQRLLFFKEKKSGKWLETNESYNQLNFSTFKLAKIKTPPRKLKLEDLNKLWIHKNQGIFLQNNQVYVVRILSNGSVALISLTPNGQFEIIKKVNDFYDTFREATQEDIDNLTKGN